MQIVKNWSAESGAQCISLCGQTLAGDDIRISGVEIIDADAATVDTGEPNERLVPVATDGTGAKYALA
jgi:hypothetical protein